MKTSPNKDRESWLFQMAIILMVSWDMQTGQLAIPKTQ